MIPFEQARSVILANAATLESHEHGLAQLSGSYLAEPLCATSDLPRFDNSAVDGFAVYAGDLCSAGTNTPVCLRVIGIVQAGEPHQAKLDPGYALKVMTGAPVPASAQAIVMREYCQESNGNVLVYRKVEHGENIRKQGAECKKGQELLPRGSLVTPAVIGQLAALGYISYPVYQKPRIAIVSTGNELVQPGQPLEPGQVYDSNSYALIAAVAGLGIDTCASFAAPDNTSLIRGVISQAVSEADVLITTGGVSVGDFDLLRSTLADCGVRELFWRIAIKPGKPVYFGVLEPPLGSKRTLVFGLPGNPASALVTFHQLVRPALLKMLGATTLYPPTFTAILTDTIHKEAGRLEFIRGILYSRSGRLMVKPAGAQGSQMLGGLCYANCLIRCDANADLLADGEQVSVDWLDWNN